MPLDMDLTDLIVIITFISGIVGLIRALFGILADAPKALENARKGWAMVRSWFTSKKSPAPTIVPLTGTLRATGGRLILSGQLSARAEGSASTSATLA
jgi:hypothetical protein